MDGGTREIGDREGTRRGPLFGIRRDPQRGRNLMPVKKWEDSCDDVTYRPVPDGFDMYVPGT